MEKKKILLVDDQYDIFEQTIKWIAEDLEMELIRTKAATDLTSALEIIEGHPEADFILLDGSLGIISCTDVLRFLGEPTFSKIICFSGDPKRWKGSLVKYGIKHFGGKQNVTKCLNGTCSC